MAYKKFQLFILVSALCAYFLMPWGYSHYLALAVFPVLAGLFCRRRDYYSVDFYFLFLFSLFYAIFAANGYYNTYGLGGVLKYAFVPWLVFLLGRAMAELSIDELNFVRWFFIVLGFFSAISLVSIALDIYDVGFISVARNIKVLGEGDDLKNATAINALISPWIALSGLYFFKARGRVPLFYMTVLLSAFAVFSTLRMGNRTGLVILGVTLFASYVFNYREAGFFKKVVFYIFLIAFFSFVVEFSDALFFAFQDRVDSDDSGLATAGGRLQMMEYFFMTIPDYPFGGVPPGDLGMQYAHNYFLDIAKVSGVIPFVFAMLFSVVSLSRLVSVLRGGGPRLIKNIFLFLNISFLCVFLVEPVIEGCFNIFLLYIFCSGIVASAEKQYQYRC